MNIVISGNYDTSQLNHTNYRVSKILRPGCKLYVGSKCNDGRPISESVRYKEAVKLGIPIIRRKSIVAVNAVKLQQNCTSFIDKYTPTNVSEIIGHKEQINQITQWIQLWSTGIPAIRSLLITGPPGIGKTTTVHLIAKSLGYKISEYNASDTRSVSMIRGFIALGIKRLVKEIIVMDEVDGLSERGGIGELADIIKKTTTPIICIANDIPPKLRPIINSSIKIKFNRPIKSSIATHLLKVAQQEKIEITKTELEGLCEQNGNDIRSILNNLEFYNSTILENENDKDSSLRLDMFSATQKLLRSKTLDKNESRNLVFVDYGMIPLMIQEAYLPTCSNLEEAVKSSEYLSIGDIIDKRIHRQQEWSLLPYYVENVVSVAHTVSGIPPFQVFPQWLGKNSKHLKHKRYLENLSTKLRCSPTSMRCDYAHPVNNIIMKGLLENNIKGTITQLDELHLSRDDVMEQLHEFMFENIEIPTKIKSAFTREYNKSHSSNKTFKKYNEDATDDLGDNEDATDDANLDIDMDLDIDLGN